MRRYAWLKEPYISAEDIVYKIMIYKAEEGIYLFTYSSPEAVQCASDRLYGSIEEILEEWNDLIDERGWIGIDDPLPYCQHDAFIPIRVKGRNTGKPQWGHLETLEGGEWVEYIPPDCG